jgi:hypothetical protein
MAKSLGQIHVVNSIFPVNNTTGDKFNIDLPGQLTSQLQTMVRAGTYHKVVGIDMTLDTQGTLGGGQVSGSILYYAPTHGRCSAYRAAFKSMAEVMKTQGISMRENRLYDFKAPINVAGTVNVFQNQATLDGTNGLALNNTVNAGASIFGVHNKSVRPQYTGTTGDLFQPGFDTILQSSATGTDFVLNDTVPFTGDRDVAATEYESIPFTLTWTPDTTDLAIGMEWRPDPALFLAVMCGQLQVVIEEFNADGGSPGVNINIAVMVSGWKSIMGDPSKKKVRKSRTRNLAKAMAPKLHRK